MFFYFNWLIKKRTTGSSFDERKDEYMRLIADMDRVTDRDLQLVEDRIKKLNEIVEDADKRIAVYVKELEKSRSSEALYTSLGKGIRDALNTPESKVNTAQGFPIDTIELSPQVVIPKPPVIQQPVVKPQAPIPVSPPPPPPPPSKKQIRSHIDLLLNEGISVQEIASRLSISIGEVELAINLRRNNKK